jgi:hypothetical protein
MNNITIEININNILLNPLECCDIKKGIIVRFPFKIYNLIIQRVDFLQQKGQPVCGLLVQV